MFFWKKCEKCDNLWKSGLKFFTKVAFFSVSTELFSTFGKYWIVCETLRLCPLSCKTACRQKPRRGILPADRQSTCRGDASFICITCPAALTSFAKSISPEMTIHLSSRFTKNIRSNFIASAFSTPPTELVVDIYSGCQKQNPRTEQFPILCGGMLALWFSSGC